MAQTQTIFMLGWEFPPFNSGGLGVACEGLVKGLTGKGKRVIFVLPKRLPLSLPFCRFVFASETEAVAVNSLLLPYLDSAGYQRQLSEKERSFYGQDLFSEVYRYAQQMKQLALKYRFDLIHAHDWLCFPAGLMAQQVAQKPLIIHVHATEFDRTGGHNINHNVYQIEKTAMEQAQAIITVSGFSKEKIVNYYSINPNKIKIVYNAVEPAGLSQLDEHILKKQSQVVLFLGRLTLQKGPDYFLRAAQKVLNVNNNVFFVMAGSGDMEVQMINLAIDLGIADKVFFTGFLRGPSLERIYQLADLYVLSSVSEPFGITVLEAMTYRAPVLLSNQSGSAELVKNCLKVDFWDIDQMANKILAVLNYQALRDSLRENGAVEVRQFTWQEAAKKCLDVYNEVLAI